MGKLNSIKDTKMKLLLGLIASVLGHGRMMEPPARSSYHRVQDDPNIAPFMDLVIPNWQDNELFCGGFHVQVQNGYRCGVCGDNWADERPRNNELGGRHGSTGIIPRTYESNGLMPVTIQLTAHHKGWFEFKLCKIGKTDVTEDEECFNGPNSIVQLENGGTRFSVQYVINEWFNFNLIIPDIECDHCVLQWRYHTGNSWGSDDEGTGIGYGPQEEFYGCADVEIIRTSSNPPTTKPTTTTTTEANTTKDPTTTNQSTTKQTTANQTTTKQTTEKPSQKPPAGKDFCSNQRDGIYPHEECNKFYHCSHGYTYIKDCPRGLHFNPSVLSCDWPANAETHNPNCTK